MRKQRDGAAGGMLLLSLPAHVLTHNDTFLRMHVPQQTSSPTTTAQPTNAEVKAQIRQTIIDATDAAREAGQAAREAGRAARDAGRNGPPVFARVPPGGTYTVHSDPFVRDGIPPQVVDISIAFFIMCAVMVIGWPIARAFGKRLERRSDGPAVSAGLTDQLQRIERAVDVMSIEIERISESQRFMAKLQNAQTPERVALPADRR